MCRTPLGVEALLREARAWPDESWAFVFRVTYGEQCNDIVLVRGIRRSFR